MNEKPIKVDIDFGEALRRIANTPKSVIKDEKEIKDKISENKIAGNKSKSEIK